MDPAPAGSAPSATTSRAALPNAEALQAPDHGLHLVDGVHMPQVVSAH